MMPEYATIRALIKADFADIIGIANKRFGLEYLSLNDLQEYLSDDNKIAIVALANNEIAGFALAQICDFDEVMALVLCEHDWFKEQFSQMHSIGVLKMIAVSSKHSNHGIGTALTKYRMEILKKLSKSILAVSWEQKKDSSNTRILEKFGLTLKRTIVNYWTKDSLDKEYSCEQCGVPPCKCNAMIYT